MLLVTIQTADDVIERIEIVNRGATEPKLPAHIDRGLGERRYTWRTIHAGNPRHGSLVHAREDGAVRLVAAVLEQYLEAG